MPKPPELQRKQERSKVILGRNACPATSDCTASKATACPQRAFVCSERVSDVKAIRTPAKTIAIQGRFEKHMRVSRNQGLQRKQGNSPPTEGIRMFRGGERCQSHQNSSKNNSDPRSSWKTCVSRHQGLQRKRGNSPHRGHSYAQRV